MSYIVKSHGSNASDIDFNHMDDHFNNLVKFTIKAYDNGQIDRNTLEYALAIYIERFVKNKVSDMVSKYLENKLDDILINNIIQRMK